MLEQLVESRSNYETNKKRGGYLFTTAFLVFSLFASGILWSLFAKNLEIGNDALELSDIVAPPQMLNEKPPAPEPQRQIRETRAVNSVENVATRQENMARVDEPFIPKGVSTAQNTVKERPHGDFRIGKINADPAENSSNNFRERTDSIGSSRVVADSRTEPETGDPPPPIIKRHTEQPPAQVAPKPVPSKGVVNGMASFLPKPTYPAAAKALRLGGDVSVQVTIDESGNVISANAVSGPSLLRQASEQAARLAKFKPTRLSDIPVKVTGVIVYKFAAQ